MMSERTPHQTRVMNGLGHTVAIREILVKQLLKQVMVATLPLEALIWGTEIVIFMWLKWTIRVM